MVLLMKSSISEISMRHIMLVMILMACSVLKVPAQDMVVQQEDTIIDISLLKYQKRIETAKDHWMKLLPNISVVQYAGNIGFFSVGMGWDYGKRDRWETHLMLGILPKEVMSDNMLTLTIRENLCPWEIKFNEHVSWNPANFSLALNTVFNDEFWYTETERYPGDYYRFSSKVRIQLGLGGQFNLYLKDNKMLTDRLSFYYEVSSYDLAIISYVPNRYLEFYDIIALGIGLKYKFF